MFFSITFRVNSVYYLVFWGISLHLLESYYSTGIQKIQVQVILFSKCVSTGFGIFCLPYFSNNRKHVGMWRGSWGIPASIHLMYAMLPSRLWLPVPQSGTSLTQDVVLHAMESLSLWLVVLSYWMREHWKDHDFNKVMTMNIFIFILHFEAQLRCVIGMLTECTLAGY